MPEVRTRKFGFSRTRASSISATAAINTIIDIDQAVFPSPDYEMQPNTHQLGPSIGPTEQRTLAKRHRVQLRQQWGTPHFLALAAAYTFGEKAAVTSPPGGKRHKFTIPKAKRERPVFSMREVIDDAATTKIARPYHGCGGESLTISANIGADRYVRIGWDVAMSRMGSADNTGIADSMRDPDAEHCLDGAVTGATQGTNVYLKDVGGESDKAGALTEPTTYAGSTTNLANIAAANDVITEDIHSLEFTYNINPDIANLYRMGSGKTFGAWERGETPSVGLRLNFKYKNEDAMDDYDANKEMACQVNLGTGVRATGNSGTYKGATLIIPKMFYTGYSRENVSGEQVIAANFTPMWGGGASSSPLPEVILYIWNKQDDYA